MLQKVLRFGSSVIVDDGIQYGLLHGGFVPGDLVLQLLAFLHGFVEGMLQLLQIFHAGVRVLDYFLGQVMQRDKGALHSENDQKYAQNAQKNQKEVSAPECGIHLFKQEFVGDQRG